MTASTHTWPTKKRTSVVSRTHKRNLLAVSIPLRPRTIGHTTTTNVGYDGWSDPQVVHIPALALGSGAQHTTHTIGLIGLVFVGVFVVKVGLQFFDGETQ
jgi:hypothetical protein